MKIQDIILLCSVTFAAGMVVPLAFIDVHEKNRNADAVVVQPEVATAQNDEAPLRRNLSVQTLLPTAGRIIEAPAVASEPAHRQETLPQLEPDVGDFTRVDLDFAADPGATTVAKEIAPSGDALASVSASSGSEQNLVADIQTELLIRGYSPGAVDGKWAPGTRSAVTAFQRDQHLAETGEIDGATLSALNIEAQSAAPALEKLHNRAKPTVTAKAGLLKDVSELSDEQAGQPIRLNFYSR